MLVHSLCDDEMKPFEGQFDWFELGRIHRIKSFSNGHRVRGHEYDLVQCIIFLERFRQDATSRERLPYSVKSAERLLADLRALARPARTPVNASSLPLREAPHDSGSLWVAGPLTCESFIHSSLAGLSRRTRRTVCNER
jgi:hypothetical protein